MLPVVYLAYNFRNQGEELERGSRERRKATGKCKNGWVMYKILHTGTSKAQAAGDTLRYAEYRVALY